MLRTIWNRITRIFSKTQYFEVQDFNFSDYSVVFSELNDDIVLRIVEYIKENKLSDQKQVIIDRTKNCRSLDTIAELVYELKRIIASDSKEHNEDDDAHYTFKYFIDNSFRESNSIKICNVLSGIDETTGNVIYKVAEIFRSEEKYILVYDKSE